MFLHELLFNKRTGGHRVDKEGNRRFPSAEFYGKAIFFTLQGISKADRRGFYNLKDWKVDGISGGAIWLRPLTPLELADQERGYSLSHTSL